MNRVLNWRPSLRDHRDFSYSLVEPHEVAALPPKVDLRPFCPPVVDQGEMGSCSGNAAASGVEFLAMLEERMNLPVDQAPQQYDGDKFIAASRLFIYWFERDLEGTTDQDAGVTSLRDACHVLVTKGVCREALWPYQESNLLAKPSAAAIAEAKLHQVAVYYHLSGINDLKRCLAKGFPFLFGISVYTSFMGDEAARTGVIHMPSSNESLEGGHALLCVGYDDVKQHFIFKNSWGTQWGDKGYGYLPYAYMTNPRMADDFYTLRRAFGK